MNITVQNINLLVAFWLSFCKWAAFLNFIPMIDQIRIPNIVKLLFFFLVSYALFPYVQHHILADINTLNVNNIWILTLFYVMNGLILGFLLKAIMLIFASAGSLITQQIGFASVQAFDPSFQTQTGPFEKLIVWTLSLALVLSGVFNPIFKALITSFESTSLSNISFNVKLFHFFNYFFKELIVASLILSIPMLFINFLVNAILGIISRVVPQMNVLMVSFVINIALGLLIFYVISNEFFTVSMNIYIDRLENWFNFVK